MKSLQTLEPVIFFASGVCFHIPSKIIGKSEDVTISSKAYKTDKTNKVGVDKLIRIFCSLLKFTIVGLYGFCLLTTIADNFIRLVYEVDIKVLKILSEYLAVEVSQPFVPGCKSFLCCWHTYLINKNVWPLLKVDISANELHGCIG